MYLRNTELLVYYMVYLSKKGVNKHEWKRGKMTKKYNLFAILLMGILLCLNGCSNRAEKINIEEQDKLMVYTSHKPEVYEPIIREFESRTGIWVEVVQGGTTQLMEQLAGDEQCGYIDVMFGGGVESYATHEQYFEPYQCSEQHKLMNAYHSDENVWTVFSELPIVIIYNDKLLPDEELPTGWNDLMDEKWKGKIAFADPQNSGSSCTALVTICQILDKNCAQFVESFMYQLNYEVSTSSQGAIDDVVSGKKLLGITLEETALKAINKGEDVGMIYPVEGTSAIPDGCAMVKNAPHQENARRFIDFIVSKDVQTYIVEKCCRRSVRTDIKQMQMDDSLYKIEFNLENASKMQSEILDFWVRNKRER